MRLVVVSRESENITLVSEVKYGYFVTVIIQSEGIA